MKQVYLLLLLCLTVSVARAQMGVINGQVTDYATNRPLPGAQVIVEFSTLSASTDGSGHFVIKNVPPGVHTLVISLGDYRTRKVENVVVEPKRSTQVRTTLKTNIEKLERKDPKGRKRQDTEISLVADIKANEGITSGISSEQILKAQDIDAAYAVKRLNGVTLMEDRFALVRGLGDRYNTVLLNNGMPPSMEVDSKSFSFDVLPSTVLERMVIYKSPAAELPGEFAGGVIRVTTKDIPDQNKIYFGAGISYRNMTTFNTYKANLGATTDLLGYDNGTRDLPSNFPSYIYSFRTPSEGEQWVMPNNWNTSLRTALPDLRGYVGLARKWNLGNNVVLANLTNVTYSYDYQKIDAVRARYFPEQATPGLKKGVRDTLLSFKDDIFTTTARYGAVHSWVLAIDRRNKIEFKNLFHGLGRNDRNYRTGYNKERQYYNPKDSGVGLQGTSYRWEERRFYNGSLAGSHSFSDNMSLQWLLGYGHSTRREPDWKRSFEIKNLTPGAGFFQSYPEEPNINSNSHFFSTMRENSFTQAADFEYIVNPYKAEEDQDKVKFGFYAEQRNREFEARWFSYRRSPYRFNPNLFNTPLSQRFAPRNMNDSTGFILQEGTRPTDAYLAQNRLFAIYMSYLRKVGNRGQIYAGLRYEHNTQALQSGVQEDSVLDFVRPVTNLLPSVNYTYSINAINQLRLAWGMTVNRPILRELAPFQYNDYDLYITVAGNPDLRNATIHNIDLRYEHYPNKGEYVAVGGFYKHFKNPIERVIVQGIALQDLSYINAVQANSIGAEFEARKTFAGITRNLSWLDRTYFLGNLTIAYSRVELPKLANLPHLDKNRPMMGQAPYMLNAGIYYDDPAKLSHFNIMYSVVGPRVFSVGDQLSPTQYEMPRHVFDFNMTKFVANTWEMRLTVHDLLNQPYVIRQDTNRDGIVQANEGLISRYRRGTWVTVGITYKIIN